MTNNTASAKSGAAPLKLNMKRTFIIGFAFFGILLMWQVYDSNVSSFLSELFIKAFNISWSTAAEHEVAARQVSWIVGIMMAIDNLAALIMMPIFGRLSDKTNSRFGKRMPFIIIGTFITAMAFPFIPVAFHYNNLVAFIILLAITVFSAMMYRNPAVALMPDLTPKPLRSKANGIINIMGYIGGAIPTVLGMFLVLSDYLGITNKHPGQVGQLWVIMVPFLLASVLMIASVVVLFFTIKENKIKEEIRDELLAGEKEAEIVDSVVDENGEEKALSKANKIMLILILAAEFFWFMADNGVSTFMSNYTIYHLQASTGSLSINTIISGLMSVVGFAIGGLVASKIGRKYTLWGGLGITLVSYVAWLVLGLSIQPDGNFPIYIYILFAFKGFGMSLVHLNSFPMVVELCPSSKIGRYTGYYYASSMLAQTITPMLLGLLLRIPNFGFDLLPLYALGCTAVAFIIFIFVKNVKGKVEVKKGLEALDTDD